MSQNKEEAWPCASFVGQVENVLEKENISRAELARRMGKTSAYVSQVLGKPSNMTLNTMMDIAKALGHRIHMIVYKISDDTVPTPLTAVSGVWKERVKVDGSNAISTLVEALKAIDGVEDAEDASGTLELLMDKDYEAINPTALSHAFTSIAFIKRLAGINFPVNIKYTEDEEEESEE